ncbi:alanine--glyoxylate aminotransferase family protein [Haematobacter massiliensis]|uniref:Aminotransferase n=1 Tax=Haematobacter massiliensis TaxID=195105 RepID=A0A086Y329_9RHOB|nr:alanine--glyoxylate aminotransferase family protein [Haematobacter massiliensis]KFI28679.1 aminotransferase [Haematobacter massiliensis]OWJ73528.1 alanine--glyoxylate aminotransferase family protein [Haematobacter massiliensis]OWJ88610.1 alanine--glyoxylate aminotransferase family protein [Haematobacter massiliensis]QBJ26223.1 alanine--glyoxylate aminotransferase family protein [Haematobacter massiliensis]
MPLPPEAGSLFTLTTGPVACYPEVLSALAQPVLSDADPAFRALYSATLEKLRRALPAPKAVILQGEPVLGLEAAALSLVAPGDVVLNLASGVYGAGYSQWLSRNAKVVNEVRTAFDAVIDPEHVRQALLEHPETAVVAVCHHDTPSGTLNPLAEIGRVVREHGALLVVDAVSSWAGMEVDMAGWGIDLLVTGPNKCLGCPPGLTLLGISRRAWEKMRTNPVSPRGSFLSILDWEGMEDPGRAFPFSPSVAEVHGLAAGLDRYLAEGPEVVWARHALTGAAMRAGVKAMGLTLWPAREETAAATCTAIRLPDGVEQTALRNAMRENYGVVISAGRADTLNRLIRVGHMGPTAEPIYVPLVLTALAGALGRVSGRKWDLGSAVTAALDVMESGT